MQELLLRAARGTDLHRERLRPQAVALADMAGAVVLVALELLADPGRVGLAVAALHVRDHALEGPRDLIDAAALVVAELDLLLPGAVQEHLMHMRGQVLPRGARLEVVMLGDGLDGLQEVGRLALAPRRQRAVRELQRGVGHDEALVEEELDPEAVAFRAGTERGVEREQARLDLGDGEP